MILWGGAPVMVPMGNGIMHVPGYDFVILNLYLHIEQSLLWYVLLSLKDERSFTIARRNFSDVKGTFVSKLAICWLVVEVPTEDHGGGNHQLIK